MHKRTDVKAMDGVNGIPLYTAKCQNDTSVTRIGDPSLFPPDNIEAYYKMQESEDLPNENEEDLDEIVSSLVRQFLFTNLQYSLLEHSLPSHKLEHPNTAKNLRAWIRKSWMQSGRRLGPPRS